MIPRTFRSRIGRYARWFALVVLILLVGGACQPIQAPDVAPDVDRVGFPGDLENDYTIFYEFDRPDNRSARVIYANEQAAQVQPGEEFPYGSELVMAVYRTQQDDDGNVILDDNGRYVRDELFGFFSMRKEPGFGGKYGEFRNGEWEYAAYRPDGSYVASPENTTNCARCHIEASMGKDWVFGTHRFFGATTPTAEDVPENTVYLVDYSLVPGTITVTVGSEVTWVNNDVFMHTVTANDQSWGSGALRVGASYTNQFDQVGTYEYFCAIHPSMRGTVVVVEN